MRFFENLGSNKRGLLLPSVALSLQLRGICLSTLV